MDKPEQEIILKAFRNADASSLSEDLPPLWLYPRFFVEFHKIPIEGQNALLEILEKIQRKPDSPPLLGTIFTKGDFCAYFFYSNFVLYWRLRRDKPQSFLSLRDPLPRVQAIEITEIAAIQPQSTLYHFWDKLTRWY